jgi:hypothetical protein
VRKNLRELVWEELDKYILLLNEAAENPSVILSQRMANIHAEAACKLSKELGIPFEEARRIFSILLRSSRDFRFSAGNIRMDIVGAQVFLYVISGMTQGTHVDGYRDTPAGIPVCTSADQFAEVEAFMTSEGLTGERHSDTTGSYHLQYIRSGYLLDVDSSEKCLQKFAVLRK